MTFGGSPCPSIWGFISDSIADLGNALIHDTTWDWKNINNPLSLSLPDPVPLPHEIPYNTAKPLLVILPNNVKGKADVYIDDFIVVTPDLPGNCPQVNAAIPLAIHTLSRPLDETDHIPRRNILAMKKFIAEGKQEERKIVLGWLIDTRSLTISLPTDKYTKWKSDLELLLNQPKIHLKTLEIAVGRLNHIGNIIPMLRHFLGRIRAALSRCIQHQWTSLHVQEKSDIHLMIRFLQDTNNGISINNVVFRKPSIIYRSDASEFGLGGYNISSGQAWRFHIPEHLRLRASLNSLEFISCVITIWIDVLSNDIPPESCILSQSDSSTASGWLRKSNFADYNTEVAQMTTARQLASIILKSKSCLYSQWFPGTENNISDSLLIKYSLIRACKHY
jgi:hypothetical protein